MYAVSQSSVGSSNFTWARDEAAVEEQTAERAKEGRGGGDSKGSSGDSREQSVQRGHTSKAICFLAAIITNACIPLPARMCGTGILKLE